MKAALTRALLFVSGLMLIAWGMLPSGAVVSAAPLLNVTEVPTSEPPTPTPAPPTPTEIGQLTPGPTTPPAPSPTSPAPTAPPAETPPPDRPRSTATPTATPIPPTPTPSPVPASPADPSITKSVSPATANVGDTVEYTLLVTNLGGTTATGVVVNDTLPSFLTVGGASASRGEVSLSGQSVQVRIGDLAPGETVTITISATVNAQAVAPNNRNLAIVASDTPDANPNNNQASVPLDTVPVPVTLPSTGNDGRHPLAPVALLLGLALVVASFVVRRRAA